MPSVVLGFCSGIPSGNYATNILSGNYFSGLGALHPYAGVQLRAAGTNSGNIYIALSGFMTITSGGFNTSGYPNQSGRMDGMLMAPGDAYFIPRLGINPSGGPLLYAQPDAACSGTARLFWEVF